MVAVILAQAAVGDPLVSPKTDSAWKHIRAATTTLCPGADADQATMAASQEIGDAAAYVHHIIRCGDQQKGMDQALLYTEAVSQIEGSILYMKPDADEAATWRHRAQALISKALPEAKTDPSLTALLQQLRDRLP